MPVNENATSLSSNANSSTSVALFTYGSLMFKPVWQAVTKRSHHSAQACAKGFKRKQVQGKLYPGVMSDETNDFLPGLVYFDLSSDDMALLDAYEGEIYQREPIPLYDCLAPNKKDALPVSWAYIYTIRSEYADLLVDEEWCPDRFEKVHLTSYMDQFS